jgi:hypothetical protein
MCAGNVWQHGRRIEKHGVATEWLHDRNAGVHQSLAEIVHLADAAPNVVLVDRLADPDGHRLHVTSGQAAVGVQAFKDDHQTSRFLGECGVAQTEPATDVDERVFLAGHGGAIGALAQHAQDRGDRVSLHIRFTLLYEPRCRSPPGHSPRRHPCAPACRCGAEW